MPDLTPDERRLLDQWECERRRTHAAASGLSGVQSTWSRRHRPRATQRELSTYAASFVQHAPVSRGWFRANVEEWAERQAQNWANWMFTSAEASAWLKAGLAFDEQETASLLREESVTREHLGLFIRRTTVLDRLHPQRMSVRQVADLLRREGKLDA